MLRRRHETAFLLFHSRHKQSIRLHNFPLTSSWKLLVAKQMLKLGIQIGRNGDGGGPVWNVVGMLGRQTNSSLERAKRNEAYQQTPFSKKATQGKLGKRKISTPRSQIEDSDGTSPQKTVFGFFCSILFISENAFGPQMVPPKGRSL